MSLKLHISPRIIPSIASLYNDVNRIFMEYIDNSLDSAEDFYEEKGDIYTRPITINLVVSGSSYRDGKVNILDNCTGISHLPKVVQSIGNSDKKAQAWTNGRFGYGIYSFMAACSKLEIITRLEGEKDAKYIPILKEQFETDRQEDVSFPDPKATKILNAPGTSIFLSDFDRHSWKQIDLIELKSEIEKHFELLLSRQNLKITLASEKKKQNFICVPFDYNEYEGDIYEDSLKELIYTKKGKMPQEIDIKLKKPIHIYLKVIKGKTIDKNPVFISKKRRIAEIKDIKSYKSKHKIDLWAHPNLIGYVDLGDFLGPTIARNDFKNTEESRAFYETLRSIEPLILEVIKQVNKQSVERHYQELEDRLNQALSQLAKLDKMYFRTDYLSGNTTNLRIGGMGQGIGEGQGQKDRGEKGRSQKGESIGENEGEGKGVTNKGDLPGGEGGEGPLNEEAENPFEETGFKGGEKRKSGFNIRIVDTEPDVDAESNNQLRSNIYGTEIRIFKQHPDFSERVRFTRTGGQKITQRLITYLAGEVTVHYKDQFHNKAGQPEYNKKMFVDLVDSVYQIENMLTDLEGKNLSDYE